MPFRPNLPGPGPSMGFRPTAPSGGNNIFTQALTATAVAVTATLQKLVGKTLTAGPNLVVNGEFESNVTGWFGNNATISQDSTHAHVGTFAQKVITSNTVAQEGTDISSTHPPTVAGDLIPVSPSVMVTFGAWVYGDGTGHLKLLLDVYDSGLTFIQNTASSVLVVPAAWTYYQVNRVVPASAAYVNIRFLTDTQQAFTFWVDTVSVAQGNVVVQASLQRQINKALTATAVAVTASVQKQVNKTVVATAVAVTASIQALKVILKALTATAVVVTASLQKQVSKNVTATSVAVTGSVQKLVKKNVTATAVAVSASLQALKVILKALTATPVVVTASISKRVNKNVVATPVAVTASVTKTITKTLVATSVAVTASVSKTINKTLTAVASAISATLNTLFQGGVAVSAVSVLPVASGDPSVGRVVSSTTGTWTNSPLSYTYQWQRDWGAGVFVNIPGATSATYTVAQGDINTRLRAQVVATNAQGPSLPASSNALGPVGIAYNRVVVYR